MHISEQECRYSHEKEASLNNSRLFCSENDAMSRQRNVPDER